MSVGMLRMQPEFFIIGAQKCGTTSLYNYLVQHPCVLPASEKEVHFFSDNFEKGMDWYQRHFPSYWAKLRRTVRCRHRVITGEATPFYIFHPHAPTRVAKRFPNAKIIVMLRDPVERAFSHYRYHVKLNAEDLKFEEAIAAEPQRLEGELEQMLADESYNSRNYKLFSYLKRGLYAEQLQRWLDAFSRDQILVIKSEDFFENPDPYFRQVQKFLGLPQYPLLSYKKFNAGKQAEISPEIREQLKTYFLPYNKQLNDLLGLDFAWD